jgi:hypothetical protein
VNFDGVLAFSLEQHRARILPSSPPPEAPDRAVGSVKRSMLINEGL